MKKAEEKVKSTVLQVIEQVMSAAEKEPLPTTPEAKEKYFMEQVAAGESLCNRGKFMRWSGWCDAVIDGNICRWGFL